MTCAEVEDLLGAFALGALPPDAHHELLRHLSSCDAHEDVVVLRAAALSLAASTPERTPPPALRDRLLDTVSGEAGPAPGISHQPTTIATGRRPSLGRIRLNAVVVAAALALLAIGLLSWNVVLQVSDAGAAAVPVVYEFEGASGASGRVLFLESEALAVLQFRGLSPLPADRVYQVWTIGPEGAASAGIFNASADGVARIVVSLERDLTTAIALSEEPSGGSEQPTSDPLIGAPLEEF